MSQMIAFPKYDTYKPGKSPWLQSVPDHWDLLPGLAVLKENKDKNIGMVEETVLSLSYGKVIVKPPEKLTGLVPESFETYQVINPNDIIIRPTDLQNDQTSLRTGLAKDRGIITSAYICLRPDPAHNPHFIHYLLHAFDLLKVYYGMGSGLRQNLDFRDFKRLELCIPPRDEQDRIANFLDQKTAEIDEAIAKKQRLIELLKEQKATLINQAVTKGLNPDVPMRDSGVEWIGEVPCAWKIVPLKWYLRVSSGDFIEGNLISNSPTGTSNIPVVGGNGVMGFTDRSNTTASTIIIGRVGALCGNVHSFETETWVTDNAIITTHSSTILQNFLKMALTTLNLNKLANKSAQPLITGTMVKSQKIPLPSYEEQEAIVQYCYKIDADIAQLLSEIQDEIRLLSEFKQVVISEAVSGKIKI